MSSTHNRISRNVSSHIGNYFTKCIYTKYIPVTGQLRGVYAVIIADFRFIGENLNSVKPYTYLPFGAGPRNCIGMRFGLEALKLCLLHSVRNAIFVRSVKTKIPLELFKGFGVISSSDITVCVKRRSR